MTQKRKAMATAAAVEQKIKEPKETNVFDEEQNMALFEEYQKTKSSEIRNKIFLNNTRLVTYTVYKNFAKQLNKEELIQEGNLALFEAIDGFNPNFGCKFSTYATFWIKQTVMKFLSSDQVKLYIPYHIRTARNKFAKAIKTAGEKLEDYLYDEKKAKELCKKLEISNETYEKIVFALGTSEVLSFNTPIRKRKEETTGDFQRTIQDLLKVEAEEENSLILNDFLEKVNKALNKLTEKEKTILLLRFDAEKESEKQ